MRVSPLALTAVLVASALLVSACTAPPSPIAATAPPTAAPVASPATTPPAAPTAFPPASPPVPAGDAARGQTLFAASCAVCHSPNEPFSPGKGTPVGPGLAGVSAKGESYIRESIVNPSAVVAEGFVDAMPKTFARDLCGTDYPAALAGCKNLNDLVAYLLSL